MSLHTFFGPNASRKRPLDESSSSSAEAAPLPDPRTFVAWNADSLLTRVKKNASELGAFLATTRPDVVFVSEVRMPARGPPGAKPTFDMYISRGVLGVCTSTHSAGLAHRPPCPPRSERTSVA